MPLAVYALALIVLLVALARPQTTVAVPIERASIMLTTDYSGSMQATDVAPTRLAAARAAAERFLDQVPGTRPRRARVLQPGRAARREPDDRPRAVRAAIATLKPSGGTATGEALAVSLTALASEIDDQGVRVPAAIVLLSDGKSTRGRTPQELAQRAKELKIPIYTVTLGTAAGTIPVHKKDGTIQQTPGPARPRRDARRRVDLARPRVHRRQPRRS